MFNLSASLRSNICKYCGPFYHEMYKREYRQELSPLNVYGEDKRFKLQKERKVSSQQPLLKLTNIICKLISMGFSLSSCRTGLLPAGLVASQLRPLHSFLPNANILFLWHFQTYICRYVSLPGPVVYSFNPNFSQEIKQLFELLA